MKRHCKKAQGISMSMLVVAAIAVMVLLVMGVFFSGGFSKIGQSMMGFISGTSDESSAQSATACHTWCVANSTDSAAGDPPDGCIC